MTHADGSKVLITDLTNIDERLDIWAGILTSSFTVDGAPVHVETIAHPDRDEVAVRIESPLIAAGRSRSASPSPTPPTPSAPTTRTGTTPKPTPLCSRAAAPPRRLRPHARLHALHGPRPVVARRNPRRDRAASVPPRSHAATSSSLRGSRRTPIAPQPDSVAAVEAASRAHWQHYWTTGGAIDLSGNADPRAAELERRIVLSQYVMAVHDAGSWPPQETGLAVNSWFGKFHMEMYWWHAAHWALWGHPEILEKSLSHLTQLMPPGEAMARREGARASSGPR
jgi:hypothetical protein